MYNVFELVTNTRTQVVIKVHSENNLMIALHPYISGDMDYLTVTKGEDKTLTVIRKDGTTWSFDWGVHGHTLISNSTEQLRQKVVEFVQKECHILLDWGEEWPKAIKMYYNPNYRKWQLTLEGRHDAYYWSDSARGFLDMLKECEGILERYLIKGWAEYTAPTGIKVFKAVF